VVGWVGPPPVGEGPRGVGCCGGVAEATVGRVGRERASSTPVDRRTPPRMDSISPVDPGVAATSGVRTGATGMGVPPLGCARASSREKTRRGTSGGRVVGGVVGEGVVGPGREDRARAERMVSRMAWARRLPERATRWRTVASPERPRLERMAASRRAVDGGGVAVAPRRRVSMRAVRWGLGRTENWEVMRPGSTRSAGLDSDRRVRGDRSNPGSTGRRAKKASRSGRRGTQRGGWASSEAPPRPLSS
jgi:hypothetical protein